MPEPQGPLSYAIGLGSLGVYSRRVAQTVVGRATEMTAIERALPSAQAGLVCLTLEGEPGIGKTRLLVAAEEMTRAKGFAPIAVTADEEIRGPFLLARSIFASPSLLEPGWQAGAQQAVERIYSALSSMDDPAAQGMSADRQLLRIFDLAALALRTLAAERPIALLIDDLQWADADSIRLLRYAVRANARSRMLLVLASRPNEAAFVSEAMNLLGDMERMGLLRRLRLERFSLKESTDFLRQVLGGELEPASASAMHVQAEGVPFILAEQAQAYRAAGLLQRIDGAWTLARNAAQQLPSAVRMLIQRRMTPLPEGAKAAIADAAILGRSFSLRDVREIRTRLNDALSDTQALAEALAPAVGAGLLAQQPPGSSADYTFTHEGIREYAASALSGTRRRAIHEAIVQMLTGAGPVPPTVLPLLAKHALGAGRTDLAARTTLDAARSALRAHAPEEVLRLAGEAQAIPFGAQDRVALLCLQDDALEMLRRTSQRLEGLAQLSALAAALHDPGLELQAMLRRAAALRLSLDYEDAAELARRVRRMASERQDSASELAACMELGQALLRSELGEGYVPVAGEVDLDGAAEVYQRASQLAEAAGDEAKLAAATRELGSIVMARVRALFVPVVRAGEHIPMLKHLAAGGTLADLLAGSPIASMLLEADAYYRRALDLYERLGDRQGVMSSIIGMAYVSWGPDLHLPSSAHRIEEIRRLANQKKSLVSDSQRALADAQMLYGVHVYARAKVSPDTALAKGQEAYAAARALGQSALEFACAGSVALAYADLGSADEAGRWLQRAAEVAAAIPTPLRARLLESWRGRVCAASGDALGMREHLQRAVEIAADQGRPFARCETYARLALEAARLGAMTKDPDLLTLAEESAKEALALVPALPGRPPWGAQAKAALARVALAKGDKAAALAAARAAYAAVQQAEHEDLLLEVQAPAAEVLLALGTEEEATVVRDRLGLTLAFIVPRILDEEVRLRWLNGPIGREITALAGPVASAGQLAVSPPLALAGQDAALLRLLVAGRSNAEIAREVQATDEQVTRRLAELYVKIGASSRGEATSIALMGNLV